MLDSLPTTISILASVPIPVEGDWYIKSKLVYENGSSNTTSGGFNGSYPLPGLVILTPTTLPLLTVAVPINSIFGVPVLAVWTPTFTIVCIPTL